MKFDHFEVRLLNGNDAGQYFLIIENNRKRLEDFFAGTVARTKTEEDAALFLQELLQRAEAKIFFPYGIFDLHNDALIGYLHVFNFDWNIPKAEIGFFVDAQSSSKGIMQKAVTALTGYYFNELDFNKLFLRTHPSNTAAQKLAERCGFEKEGLIRKDYKTTGGELVDLIYYGLCK